jgi:hypothetical protein
MGGRRESGTRRAYPGALRAATAASAKPPADLLAGVREVCREIVRRYDRRYFIVAGPVPRGGAPLANRETSDVHYEGSHALTNER